MNLSSEFQTVLDRMDEVRLYLDQGLGAEVAFILHDLLDDVEKNDFLSETEKAELCGRIRSELKPLEGGGGMVKEASEPSGEGRPEIVAPGQSFHYGLALMDSQFWAEAIEEFKRAAVSGELALQCWELCGDCSSQLGLWEDAIRYYEVIYADPSVDEALRQQVLLKLTKCSQTQKNATAKLALNGKGNGSAKTNGTRPAPEPPEEERVHFKSTVHTLDQSSFGRLLGHHVYSWKDWKGAYLAGTQRPYRVVNLLHVGITSVVLELEQEETGEKLAGQILTAHFNKSLSPEVMARWVGAQRMISSRHLVRVVDLAQSGDDLVIVREYLPVSLMELLTRGEILPIPLAISLGYQILEALGDLHLHMGRDEKIRNIFHLDLRPSRILLRSEKPCLKLLNGGLWTELARANPHETAAKRLPLPFLAYRAPEQFRPYLARKKPPIFTDIYLFGTIFYEMLTGIAAFQASSFDEYEIQHCEQYPTPPKVWRPEIPEELNDMIMKCLERDPFKRWRSTTQMSLILQKSFGSSIHSLRDGHLHKFLRGL